MMIELYKNYLKENKGKYGHTADGHPTKEILQYGREIFRLEKSNGDSLQMGKERFLWYVRKCESGKKDAAWTSPVFGDIKRRMKELAEKWGDDE